MEKIDEWSVIYGDGDGAIEVIFELLILPDDSYVRGNAMASGDDEADRIVEDEILERLDRGDVSAWCGVRVEAKLGTFTGEDSIWACTLDDSYTARHIVEDYALEAGALASLKETLKMEVWNGLDAKARMEQLDAALR